MIRWKACGVPQRLREVNIPEADVNGARDVPWGTGASNAAGQLAELRWQRFGGVVLIEYEHNNAELEKNTGLCVEYFNRVMAAPLNDLVGGRVVPPGYTGTPGQLWSGGRGTKSKRWPATDALAHLPTP